MKAVRILTLILAALAVAVLVIALLLPDHAEVERSVVIAAPPAKVFAQVDGMRAFQALSPWTRLDAGTHYQFSGPDRGVGSTMRWESDNAQVGAGSQEITVSKADSYVETKLDFGDQGGGVASFSLSPDGAGTRLTWRFRTEFGNDLFGRWFGLMLDRFLGPSYERGLKTLKERVEGGE